MTGIVQDSNGNCQPTHINDACDIHFNIYSATSMMDVDTQGDIFFLQGIHVHVYLCIHVHTKSHLRSQWFEMRHDLKVGDSLAFIQILDQEPSIVIFIELMNKHISTYTYLGCLLV